MKTRILIPLAAAVLGMLVTATRAAEPGYLPMKVTETDLPGFPQEALTSGLSEGRARVAVSIDDRGQLSDALLIAYTAPSFGRVALAAVRHWRFQPARIAGVPHGATVDFNFDFHTSGPAVIDSDEQVYLAYAWNRLFPNANSFHPWSLGQIDRIPVPTKIVRPYFPPDRAGGIVRVTFYIDPEGRVRMAAVDPAALQADPDLAAAAVNAVSQWRFEPPTRKGHAVLVYAEQEFTFKPPVAKAR